IVLSDDVILVRDSGRHPAREEISERLELHDWIHGSVCRIGLIAVVEHALVGRRRKIGRMRVHMAQKEEEWGILCGETVQLGESDAVQVLRLGASSLIPAAPSRVIEIRIKSARAWVSCESHACRDVAGFAQYFW